jgi:hypothetical protein
MTRFMLTIEYRDDEYDEVMVVDTYDAPNSTIAVQMARDDYVGAIVTHVQMIGEIDDVNAV